MKMSKKNLKNKRMIQTLRTRRKKVMMTTQKRSKI
jgi:hypothetical protein